METTNRKQRRVLLIGVAAVLLLAVIGILNLSTARADTVGDQRVDAVDEAFVISIDAMEDSIAKTKEDDPLLGLSSNPYDYISDGKNEYYNKIVALGPAALPELEGVLLESEGNGLADYLFAVAIGEIAEADVRSIDRWGYADEFRGLWLDIKQTISERVDAIVQSDELSADEKAEQLSAYGVLALPELDRIIQDGDADEELTLRLESHVESFDLSASEGEIVMSYVG